MNFLSLEDELNNRPIIGSYRRRIGKKLRKVFRLNHNEFTYITTGESIPRIARTHYINDGIIKNRKHSLSKIKYGIKKNESR